MEANDEDGPSCNYSARFGNSTITVAYGAQRESLTFSIALHDFIMERYPGTNSAFSHASEVTLVDPRTNLKKISAST